MGDVVARATQPALGAVKLAWWRERLEELDQRHGRPPSRGCRRRPSICCRAVSAARSWRRSKTAGRRLLEETGRCRTDRRTRRADCSALARGCSAAMTSRLGDAGALYALVSVGRRGVPELLEHAKDHGSASAGIAFRRRLRPLTALARLAVRDLKSWPAVRAGRHAAARWRRCCGIAGAASSARRLTPLVPSASFADAESPQC